MGRTSKKKRIVFCSHLRTFLTDMQGHRVFKGFEDVRDSICFEFTRCRNLTVLTAEQIVLFQNYPTTQENHQNTHMHILCSDISESEVIALQEFNCCPYPN